MRDINLHVLRQQKAYIRKTLADTDAAISAPGKVPYSEIAGRLMGALSNIEVSINHVIRDEEAK
jgi:hypothetical protein